MNPVSRETDYVGEPTATIFELIEGFPRKWNGFGWK